MINQAPRYGMNKDEKDALYNSLIEKFGYDKVKFDKPVEEATESAGNKRFAGSIIDGLAQIGNANSVSRGGRGYDGGAGKLLNQAADTSISEAGAKRKAMIEDYLTKKNLYESVEGQSSDMAKQQIANDRYAKDDKYKNDMLDIQRQGLGIKAQQAQAEIDNKRTEGQKAFDKDFAKDYNEWTSGGQKTALIEIEKLKSVKDKLKGGKIDLGKSNAFVPDLLADSGRIAARADVESSVMSSLRQILGSAFTESEGKRVINATWNENDNAANNLTRLERLINKLENDVKAKNTKANYFESNKGSMSGYKSEPTEPQEPETKTIDGKTYRKVDGGWEEVD